MRDVAEGPPTSALVRFFLVALPASWACSFIAPFAAPHYLAFSPMNTVLSHLFLWGMWTQVVIELDLLTMVASLGAVWFCLRPAEAKLGTDTMVLLLLLVLGISSGFVIVASALLYGTAGWFWLYQSFAGFAPAAAVSSVALMHATRGCEYAVSPQYLNAVRTRHLPFAVVWFACGKDLWSRVLFPTASDVMTEMDIGSTEEVFEAPMLPMVLCSFFVSWFIIRFLGIGWLQMHRTSTSAVASAAARAATDDASAAGDCSPAFALHELVYPRPLRWMVLAGSTVAFRVLRTAGLGKDIDKWNQDAAAAAAGVHEDHAELVLNNYYGTSYLAMAATGGMPQRPGGGSRLDGSVASSTTVGESAPGPSLLAPLPGTTTADADRRRAVALAALTARLQRLQHGEATEHLQREATSEDASGEEVFTLDVATARTAETET